MCLVITLMGFFGGLVMSAIKRDRGVKDWGHLIAGHGGFIDRLDSVIFAAPIFFHVTRYWSGPRHDASLKTAAPLTSRNSAWAARLASLGRAARDHPQPDFARPRWASPPWASAFYALSAQWSGIAPVPLPSSSPPPPSRPASSAT